MRLRKLRIIKCLALLAAIIIAGPQIARLLTDHQGQSSAKEMGVAPIFILPREIGEQTNSVEAVAGHENAVDVVPEIEEEPKTEEPKNKKIDWHDYNGIKTEKHRKGNGEQGAPFHLTEVDVKRKDELFKMNGFNAYLSDKISVDRSTRDIRHPLCWNKTYLADLPNVSVIIPVHNEHWSVLLRSIHSILNRSPPQLIHEIILVDDFSDRQHLHQQLDDHLEYNYNGKVKVVRQGQREGLIRTRIKGAEAATGQVLLFLDSHIEANINWLPPLLEPIAEDYRTVTCPFIDVIDHDDFGLKPQDQGARGAFDWKLFYKRLPLLPESLRQPTEPFESPVMAGGLFAISTKWFWELGGYDPGLEIWGGEQYELSFKLWMCGGKMVDTPCSRVGHIYRSFNPFGAVGKGDYVSRNHLRVAEVWMDEYKKYILLHSPSMGQMDPGDLTAQKQLRVKLQCKTFDWFMKNVAFDLVKHYPPVPPKQTAYGEIRNVAANLCVDTKFRGPMASFGIDECVSDHDHGVGGEQQMELTWLDDIRPLKRPVCFDTSEKVPKAPLILYMCHGQRGNQWWKYNIETKHLYHPMSKACLDCDVERKQIFMMPCDKSSVTQRWIWSHVNETLAKKAWWAQPQ